MDQSKELPEYVVCVRQTHEEKKRLTWCDKSAGAGFLFVDVDHAAYNGLNNGRLQTCPKCARAIVAALYKGTYHEMEITDGQIG